MKKLLLTLTVVLTACESTTIPERVAGEVYEYRLSTPELRVLRWPVGTTVRVHVAADAEAARTAQLESALTHAIDAWNDAALYGEVQLARTSTVESADAVLLFSSTAPPLDLSGCPRGGALAVTTFCLDPQQPSRLAILPLLNGGGGRVKFLITIAGVVSDDELLRRLVTHELGHVLGIAQHSPRSSDLMYGGTLTTAFPSAADRATLTLLYHTRPDISP